MEEFSANFIFEELDISNYAFLGTVRTGIQKAGPL
jgi:hypothetical protein